MSAGGPSDVPVMTKTFSATLVATELLLLDLLGAERADARSATHPARPPTTPRRPSPPPSRWSTPLADELARRRATCS